MKVSRRGRVMVAALCAGVAVTATLTPVASATGARSTVPRSCSMTFSSTGPPAPTALGAVLDPAVVGRFAAFRRPATPGDQLPTLNDLEFSLGVTLRSYYPGYIRRLIVPGGAHEYFVIVGFPRAITVPPARCLPKSVRPHRAALVRQQQRAAALPVYCLVPAGRRGPVGPVCLPFAAIDTGEDLIGDSYPPRLAAALVPDGVAVVRIAYPGGHMITAPAADNVFTFRAPALRAGREERRGRRIASALSHHPSSAARKRLLAQLVTLERRLVAGSTPTLVTWLDAGGRVLRSFRPQMPSGVGLSGSATTLSSSYGSSVFYG